MMNFDFLPPWFLLILASSLALGVYDICKKKSVDGNSVMPVLFFATLTGSLFFLGVSAVNGMLGSFFGLSGHFYLLVWIKSMIVAGSWICVYYGVRELPISLSSPIRASAPLWTFIGGLILYHEVPTVWQGLAMFLIFAGYYAFSLLGKMEGIVFTASKGVALMMAGTLIGSCSALYDKYLLGVEKLPREAMQFWFSVDLVLILGAAWGIRTCFGHHHPFKWRWTIPLTGILLICADWLYFHAVSVPEAPISILSLLRRCSCLITFTAGTLFFHETNMKKKALALIPILAGVVLLALFK